jgi:regulatory protein
VNPKNEFILQKARNYTFLLLKYRQRSAHEIYRRLKRKKYDESVIKDTISFLRQKGFINDNDFARAWVESRLKKPFGLRRIKEELRQKGIEKPIIDQQIEELREDYREEDIVRKLAQDRFKKLRNLEPRKAKTRVYAWLLRRGFTPEVVIDTVNSL